LLIDSENMGLGKKVKNFVWSKQFLKHFVILIAVYFLIIQGTIWYLNSYTNHGEKVKVPNLIGKNVNSIAGQLEQAELNFEVLDSIYNPKMIEGTIISQDPSPTELSQIFVKRDRVIRLRVSKKSQLVEMPQCVDKSQRFAENILKNRGFRFKVDYKTTTEANGAVMEQRYNGKKIEAKKKIPIGSVIHITVGRNLGGEAVSLPDLMGLTIFEAKSRLASYANLNILMVCDGCVTTEDSTAAIVDSQSPEYGEDVFIPAGSTITVYAKKGGGIK